MNIELNEKNIIIASEDFKLKENDKVHLFKYFDPLNNQYLTFISTNGIYDKELYIVIKQGNMQSAFIGNLVLPAPLLLYVKRFNPLLLIIGLITLTSSKYSNRDEIDYSDILNVYREEVNKGSRINEVECLNFVKKVLYANASSLELICDVKRSEIFNDDLSFKFRLLKSKVYDFLNSKINVDKESIEAICKGKENEREEIEKKIVKERFEVLARFMPKELMMEYANEKNIKICQNIVGIMEEEKKDNKKKTNNIDMNEHLSIENTIDNTDDTKDKKNQFKRKVDKSLTEYDEDINDNKGKKGANSNNAFNSLINPSNEHKKKKNNKKAAPELNKGQGSLNAFFKRK